MANITAAPTPHEKPVKFGNYAVDMTFICSTTIVAGQVVGLNGDGQLITPAAGGAVIGGALYAGEAGDEIAVRVSGVVTMYNSDDTTAIAPGAFVSAGVFGGVKATAAGQAIVGIAVASIPGAGFGYVKLSQAPATGGA